MKSKFFKFLFLAFIVLYTQNSFGKELDINALSIEVDKTSEIIYAKGKVEISDPLNNIIFTDNAKYDKIKGIVKTIGPTKIITSEKYEIVGNSTK